MARKRDGKPPATKGPHPFRSAVLRGLGVVAPPLLTVLIFIWAGSTINQSVLSPMTRLAREALVWTVADIRTDTNSKAAVVMIEGRPYQRIADKNLVPVEVYEITRDYDRESPLPATALGVYRQYVEAKYLRPYYVIPFFLSIFVLALYLLGKFMAAGIGRFFWSNMERGINRLPLVRSVYSGVKQVSDFMFNEREFEFTRVVALEYPRKGIWSVGFVTSESFFDIRSAANEPVLVVFIPCSPMPLTGFTVSCLKSECLDLNMTFEQAFQFLISCGVVVPPHQLPELRAAAAEVPPEAPAAAPCPSEVGSSS